MPTKKFPKLKPTKIKSLKEESLAKVLNRSCKLKEENWMKTLWDDTQKETKRKESKGKTKNCIDHWGSFEILFLCSLGDIKFF